MPPPTTRRNRSRVLVLAVALLLVPMGARAEEPAFHKKTYTYKTVGEVPIRADVYRADDSRVIPAVIWLHGGALIVGSRSAVPRQLLDLCRREGFALVSLDYRLAPEVKLPAIVEDVEDAFGWLGEQGPKRLRIDPARMVVTGVALAASCLYGFGASAGTNPQPAASSKGKSLTGSNLDA